MSDSTNPIIEPLPPTVLPLTFGAWEAWTGRVANSPAGTIANPSTNGQPLWLVIVPVGGTPPTSPPSSVQATKVISPGGSWTGADLAQANGVYISQSAAGTGLTVQVADVLTLYPLGLVEQGGDTDVLGTVAVSNFPTTQAVSSADGGLTTIGAKADTANTDATSSWSVVSLLKGIWQKLAGTLTTSVSANALTNAPVTGQITISVTGTAIQLPSNAVTNGVIVSAHPLNTQPTSTTGGVVGPSADDSQTTGAFLPPGATIGFAVTNTNLLYVNGIAGDKFSYAVS